MRGTAKPVENRINYKTNEWGQESGSTMGRGGIKTSHELFREVVDFRVLRILRDKKKKKLGKQGTDYQL